VLAVPFFDLSLVVTSRVRGHRPVYLGGTDHSAHRLARLGWSHRRVALGIYGVEAIAAGLAVAISHLSPRAGLPVIAVVAAAVIAGSLALLRLEHVDQELLAHAEDPIGAA